MARRKKKSGGFILNKYNIGVPFIIIGGLYFFGLGLAKSSPMMKFFSDGASVAFWELGTSVFFGLCILTGVLLLTKGHIINTILKQFVALLMVISGILNFPIIDGQSKIYEQFGGYISRPIIQILTQTLWNNPMAIKVFFIILFAIMIGWVIYAFNISMPKINLHIHHDETPVEKKPSRKQEDEEEYPSPQKSTNEKKSWLGAIFSAFTKNESDSKNTQKITSAESQSKNSLIKDLLKSSIQKKIETKVQQLAISYPDDKPTFSEDLMEASPHITKQVDETYLIEKAQALQAKLREFNIPVDIQWFEIGPSVVQIKIKPESGIKISAIETYHKDIASALRAKSLRIIAPIPGTDSVGLEIPNPIPQMVRLRDVLCGVDFSNAMKNNLTNLSLGKGIDGKMIIKSLESMPHLLVAGATGSGKSVGVNDFILSLIYQNTPAELKFLMIDPKQVELTMYDGIPYLLAPVENKPEKSLKMLKWAVEEMEKRYTILKDKKVRNLSEYNEKTWEPLYRIVIVIDELADLMMTGNTKKDTEICITRIAQKARAVGIHLIVATQRPSVNVITGLIKANIPTRIAFWVVSNIDSRTILDMKGAEDLVGKGDMLYIDPTTKSPLRIQAPFISGLETEKIVDELKAKYMQGITESDIYNPELMALLEAKEIVWRGSFGMGGDGGDDDELVEQATQIIIETRKASATLLQRKMGVGFARAARIMDILEEKGIVWPQDGAKPRDILV